MALGVDGEAVLAERRADRPRLDPGQVDARAWRTAPASSSSAPGLFSWMNTTSEVLSAPVGGAGGPGATPARSGSPRRRGRRSRWQESPVDRCRRRSVPRSRRRTGSPAAATIAAACAVEASSTTSASGRCVATHRRVCASAWGCVATRRMSAALYAVLGQQRELHVDPHLPGDHQRIAAEQRIQGHRHRTLDRVLDRHDGTVGLAGPHGVERGDHRAARLQLGLGRGGQRPQRSLGEGSLGAEVGETGQVALQAWPPP